MENFPNYITPKLFESRYNHIRKYLRSNNLGALIAYSTPPEHKWLTVDCVYKSLFVVIASFLDSKN